MDRQVLAANLRVWIRERLHSHGVSSASKLFDLVQFGIALSLNPDHTTAAQSGLRVRLSVDDTFSVTINLPPYRDVARDIVASGGTIGEPKYHLQGYIREADDIQWTLVDVNLTVALAQLVAREMEIEAVSKMGRGFRYASALETIHAAETTCT